MTSKNIIILTCVESELELISGLATKVWNSSFSYMLEKSQIEYMLDKFYSKMAIKEKIKKENYQYMKIIVDNKTIGFFSFYIENSIKMKICEVFILEEYQGCGIGSFVLNYIEKKAILNNCKIIYLYVNKRNKAVSLYQEKSYKIKEDCQINIGSNFIMDDYLMEKELKTVHNNK